MSRMDPTGRTGRAVVYRVRRPRRSRFALWRYVAVLAIGAMPTIGCGGIQSVLAPAGRGAEDVSQLFWVMTGMGAAIWLAVIGVAVYVTRVRPRAHPKHAATLLIIGGGAILPTMILGGLLIYGLALLPELLAPGGPGSLQISVSGEQWWWRVQYPASDGPPIELANEIRLPVGEPVDIHLSSPDVIHSFWVPSLGGKMDLVPGRLTRLTLHPTKMGVFRGICAEYCGTAHALMNFYVVVMEKSAFEAWLAREAEPASIPATPHAERGRRVFLSNGCGACHSVSGTPADGVVGPDLTHVGGRLSIGAAVLRNEASDFVRWVSDTDRVKPGVHMPAFGMLSRGDLGALAAYLDGLE